MADTKQSTRYQQVIEILDRAAAGSSVDYDGLGPFWHLPFPQFLQVEIHGVRMIAPAEAPAPSCCHAGTADSPADSRSARSGLIRGLRGQAPFDGTQYPPLPWGGQTVTEDEISFIAEWIDDGCPEGDHQISFNVEGTTTPTTIEADAPPLGKEAWAKRSKVEYTFPGTNRTTGNEITVTWYDGKDHKPTFQYVGQQQCRYQSQANAKDGNAVTQDWRPSGSHIAGAEKGELHSHTAQS
jgi:hypothetical protein